VSLRIDISQVGDVTVVELKGKMTIGAGDVQFRDEIKALMEKGSKKLVLNLQGLKYMDSSGVGELVSTYTTVTNRGGHFRLSNLSGKILDLLQITQLLQVFDTYETVEEAVNGF
jgi:anti-sigma B factor antagonist